MRFIAMLCFVFFMPAHLALGTREPTAPPVYYLIDYGRNHLDNPQYIEWTRQLPPELLHFGKDVPMTHLWGPIAALGGENQAHGRNRADIRRLSPAEVRERIAALQRMNKALHEAGVKMVMPYISAITYAGDPKTREGFFNFYDHWDEYAEFGLGPKPNSDPVEWAAIKADGSLHTFGKELAPPYYGGLNRYVACIEHPDWRRWLEHVTRLVSVAGYDGAFPDNSSPVRCYAPHCQKAFATYLSEKFTPEQLQELFGTRQAASIKLPQQGEGLLWVEANRFWQLSLARHLGAMRAAGRTVNPNFLLFPNCGTPTHSAEYLCGRVDYFMYEGSGEGPQGAGCVVTTIIGDVGRRMVIDNILEYRYCADLPGDIRPLFLNMGRTLSARKLCLAEAAAFGSGAYNGVTIGTRDALRPYIEFFLKRKELYDRKISCSRVAVLYFPMLDYYPENTHRRCVISVKDYLGALQIPFDCFSENGLDPAILTTYKVCIAPEVKFLSERNLEILREFVRKCGRLLAIGEFATHDDLCRPRTKQNIGAVTISSLPTRMEMAKLLDPNDTLRLVVDVNRPMLRVMMYESPRERIVHLLNYNCPVMSGAEPITKRNVHVRVPVPNGKTVKSVTCINPEAGEFSPEFQMRDGACWFTVTEVPIYVVCRVKFQ